ncbi:unnamed protein product [Paramecium pentaurelia]|uniref:Transmembrane protein n=1 Tax=Paramecium pentaurelia TaxID=43138 RepID=A0A8S1Y829_9CILI|nr:unnamed protein product [Paramecium pentaurelia]
MIKFLKQIAIVISILIKRLQIDLYFPLQLKHAHLNFTVQLARNHLQILKKLVHAKSINISIFITFMIVLQNVNNVQTLNSAITVYILMVNAIVEMDIILQILIQFVISVQHIIVMFVIS